MGSPGLLGGFAMASLLAMSAGGWGCASRQRGRPVRDGEKLELQSLVLTVPAGPGWQAWRSFDVPERELVLGHRGSDGTFDHLISISESDGAAPLPSRDALLARFTALGREDLGDPAALVEEVALAVPPRFGPSALAVGVRMVESDAKAGLLKKKVLYQAWIGFVSQVAPHRTSRLAWLQRSTTDLTPARFAESWRALLDGIELRPADAASVESAARAGDFPKRFEPSLARRSLTLPQLGFQLAYGRERWLAPGGSTGGWAAALGLTDHLELGTPGFLRYSFGEVEALTRGELAVGAGLSGYQHDAERGSVWGFGVELQGRRRLAADVALRGFLFAVGAHESRTGRNRPGGAAGANVVWDVLPWMTLGLEAGWSASPWKEESGSLVWVGGRGTPLATVHLPYVDVGLSAAAAWDRGSPGALAGVRLVLTL